MSCVSRSFICALVSVSFCSFLQAASVPEWASRLHSAANPTHVGAAAAAVLLDETEIDVDPLGAVTTTHRVAVRILAEQGRGAAWARVYYLQGNDKVRRAEAWLLRKGIPVKSKGREWLDMSIESTGTLYGEYRLKSISREDDAVAGDVFIAETVVTGPQIVAHKFYSWGWTYPVVEETLRIRTPPGFRLETITRGVNPPAVVTSADGRVSTWTVRDQPYIRREPMEPDFDQNSPTVYISIEPPPTNTTGFKPVLLRNWADVATWIKALNSGQCDTNPQLSETARDLTSSCVDALSKIRAIGEYVQRLRYVAVNEKLGQGFGYKARKASQVFSQGYGDCNDKANLLVAMLREVGIEARTVAARIGDDRPVLPEFASPMQFDHAICAISVDDSIRLPAVVSTPRWGRMLFFDPTDARTLLGDLPTSLQGTLVHVDDSLSDALVELPRFAPEQGHLYVRRAVLHLARDGSISGEASILGHGQAGAHLRRSLFAASTEEKLRTFSANLLGDSIRTAQLQKVTREDDSTTGICGVQFQLSKTNFVQFLPNAMGMASLDVLSRGSIPALSAPERKYPIKVLPLAYADEIHLILPEGFVHEEIPTGASIVSEFGRYETSFAMDGSKLTLIRRVELKAQTVPAADYARLKKFISDIGKADRAAILLRTRA